MVWVVGFEPTASRVRGEISVLAELYPDEYWSTLRDSNPRLRDPKSRRLPLA